MSIRSVGLRATVALAAGAGLSLAASLTSPAEAWPWDPNVTLQGSSHCGVPATTWVYVKASNGEQGWATNGAGHYKFNFHHVGTGGITVHVTYGEPGWSCHDDFGVNRPAVGTSATRNLVKVIPNG